jgi:glutaminyl-tRNA synthetase
MAKERERNDFIRDIIDADLAAGRHTTVRTRFPPEPNGYLHIGHAKSICLNFGIALEYGGTCNLRYDDTNPTKEDIEYVESIEADVRWLGFTPSAVLFSADYFGRMYELAEKLVVDGKAFVCHCSEDEIRAGRGTLSEPGTPCAHRDRAPAENLDLFRRMRAGEFPDGHCVLRARIDLASPNMKMRDPLLYRIRHAHHHRTGDAWCIYPMYDYAHPLEDAIEGITHSICTLEFENNRELYDWVIEHTGIQPVPRQYEFARLNLDYTVMSKRKLLQLVEQKHVSGWDDPRMPTIAGMRRRGYRPEAIRAFCDMIGVAKNNSVVDIGKLEYCVRDDLNRIAPRVLAVLRPLRVTLTNWDAGRVDELDAPYFPADIGTPGSRKVPLARELVIERDDFQVEPEKGYLRMAPGRTMRLRHGPCITCDEVVRDATGAVVELRCSVLAETLGGGAPSDGRKVWGVIHWVSAAHAVRAEVRLYDRLFAHPRPDDGGGDFVQALSPRSLEVVAGALVEPSVAAAAPGSRFQFERLGYFGLDTMDSRPGAPVFNRIVTLREAPAAAVAAEAPAAPTERAEKKTEKKENAKAKTRPERRSPAEYRAEARARDAELAAALERFREAGIPEDQADVLSGDRASVALHAATVAAGATPTSAARWIVLELPRALGDRPLAEAPFGGAELAALIQLADAGAITGPVAKDVLAELARAGGDPRQIVAARGLDQKLSAAAIDALVDAAIAENPGKVAELRGGRKGLLGFFVGAVVKASGGKADPKDVTAALHRKLA